MRRDRRRAAHEPDRLRRREVGDRGQRAEQERPVVGEQVLEPAEVVVEVRRLVVQRRAPEGRRHRRAVGAEGLHRFGRHAGEDVGDARRLHRERHRGPEERLVGPLGDDRRQAMGGFGIERRLGNEPVDHPAHQRRVAVDVGADLHERACAGSRRSGRRRRAWAGGRHRHRAPAHLLHAEDEAHLLRERRGRVVMQNELVHASVSGGKGGVARPPRGEDEPEGLARDRAPRRRRAPPCRAAADAGAAGDSAAPPGTGGARGGSSRDAGTAPSGRAGWPTLPQVRLVRAAVSGELKSVVGAVLADRAQAQDRLQHRQHRQQPEHARTGAAHAGRRRPGRRAAAPAGRRSPPAGRARAAARSCGEVSSSGRSGAIGGVVDRRGAEEVGEGLPGVQAEQVLRRASSTGRRGRADSRRGWRCPDPPRCRGCCDAGDGRRDRCTSRSRRPCRSAGRSHRSTPRFENSR